MRRLVQTLKACADANRIRILKMLQQKEMCVCEVAEALGVTQPSVSRHLRILGEADLVLQRREGVWMYYRLNPDPPTVYAQALLADIGSWLEDDPEIQALLKKASGLDRDILCGRPPERRPRTSPL
ncbi:MAG: winged helix-turn-helix transcriptional regulator [Deltaproteobacteria bacterium]|nr:winged helix-turn-helix transcriptional regulator [Deltaproteobacteria bacterium]MBW2121737.1 winged helix-turn-helix transcriptional regulator [Deltaproteobacteria bacterium]